MIPMNVFSFCSIVQQIRLKIYQSNWNSIQSNYIYYSNDDNTKYYSYIYIKYKGKNRWLIFLCI